MLQVVLNQGIVARGNTRRPALLDGLLVCLHLAQGAFLPAFAWVGGRWGGPRSIGRAFGHDCSTQRENKE